MLRNHLTIILLLVLSASIAFGQKSDAATVFRSARDLITDGDWARAQQKFSEYVETYPNEKNIEAALYWLAYTQQKLARYDQCQATIDRLLQKYPNTTWKEDARLLMAQLHGTPAIAYREIIPAVRAQAAVAAELDAAAAYAPAAPIAISPLPAQVIGEGVGIGVGRGS